MAKKNGHLDVVGTFEAHLILGVERSRIARFLDENRQGGDKIPEPDAVLKCGPIWYRENIEARARRMYEETTGGAGVGGEFDKWVVKRAVRRANQLPSPITEAELERIIRRPVPKKSLVSA
jgi:hypothetical protein